MVLITTTAVITMAEAITTMEVIMTMAVVVTGETKTTAMLSCDRFWLNKPHDVLLPSSALAGFHARFLLF